MKIRLLLFLLAGLVVKAEVLNDLVIKSSLVQRGTATLTNASIFGPLVIDSGDELQDTVDYSLALTPNGNTPTENDATPRPQAVATIASLLADVDPALVPGYARINVLGYESAGDGGGGIFRRVLYSSVSGTLGEGGMWFQSTYNTLYAWSRVPEGAEVDIRWFGGFPDDGVDDTDAMQSLADYIAPDGLPSTAGPGEYIISSVVFHNGSFDGKIHSRDQFSNSYDKGVRFRHALGATNHMIRIVADGTTYNKQAAFVIRNFQALGRANYNLRDPKIIISSSSRTNIVVATNDLPVNGGNSTTYPYYGYAFFFTAENKRVGSGVVKDINTGTGAIMLQENTDLYATPTTNSMLLPAGYKVVFSPSVTETNILNGAVTAVDPTSAGWAAISLESYTTNGYVLEAEISDCQLLDFHVGIRCGLQIATRLKNVWTKYSQFAGLAYAFPGYSFDMNCSDLYLQGFYRDNYSTVPDTGTYDNAAYRYGGFGGYGFDITGTFTDITCDHSVNGAYLIGGDSYIGWLLVDGPGHHGVIFDSSNYGNRTHWTIPGITVKTYSAGGNVPPVPYVAGHKRYAIVSTDQDGYSHDPKIDIASLNITRSGLATNDFDAVFDIQDASGRTKVQNIQTWVGAAALHSSTSVRKIDQIVEGRPAGVVQINEDFDSNAATGNSFAYSSTAGQLTLQAEDSPYIFMKGYGNIPIISASMANGTVTSPTAKGGGSSIGWFGFGGYDGSNFDYTAASFRGSSVNGWSGSDHSTTVSLFLTPSGSTTSAQVWQWYGDGSGSTFQTGTAPIHTVTATGGVSGYRINVLGADANNYVRFQTNGTTTHTFKPNGDIYLTGAVELGNASDTTLARSAAGKITVESVPVALVPSTETLAYSSTTVTVTAGKGPNQSSVLTCTNNFTLSFSSVADNDGGTIWVHPAATNCTVTLGSPAYGPTGTTLTITGGTGSTNHTVLAWKATTVNSTNVINVNALNYYR